MIKRREASRVDLIDRQAALNEIAEWMLEYGALNEKRERDALQHVARGIKKLPSAQPEQTDCCYCHEDSDGCVYVLEKNGHAVIHGNKLMLAAKGWRGEVEIQYCPMCGRKVKHG